MKKFNPATLHMVDTLAELFQLRVKHHAGVQLFHECLSPKNINSYSLREYQERVKKIAYAYQEMGLKKGDKMAILCPSNFDWVLVDTANWVSGLISVPLYPNSTPKEWNWIIKHSGAKAFFHSSQEKLQPLVQQVQDAHPELIVFSSENSLAPILKKGEESWKKNPHYFDRLFESIRPQDPIAIYYTSGTTGEPKGVVLNHSHILHALRTSVELLKPEQMGPQSLLTFLPFSHIMGRLESLSPLVLGWKSYYIPSPNEVEAYLPIVRPTLIFTVPRVLERILEKVEERIASRQALEKWALRKWFSFAEKISANWKWLKPVLFKKFHDVMGGQLRTAICGGAPLSLDTLQRIQDLGVTVLEGYGLTETSGSVSLNTFDQQVLSSVGRLGSSLELKVSDQAEILVRGPQVFKEYWDNPEATRESFDEEGFFRTGDIGFVDPDGFLHITDRMKDLIITAQGKNVAPQKIEKALREFSPWVEDVLVFGDRKKYLVALLTLKPERVKLFAELNQILYSSWKDLCQHRKIFLTLQQQMDDLNQSLPPHERVVHWKVLPEPFRVESGEKTPSQKLRRNWVFRKYQQDIDYLYTL